MIMLFQRSLKCRYIRRWVQRPLTNCWCHSIATGFGNRPVRRAYCSSSFNTYTSYRSFEHYPHHWRLSILKNDVLDEPRAQIHRRLVFSDNSSIRGLILMHGNTRCAAEGLKQTSHLTIFSLPSTFLFLQPSPQRCNSEDINSTSRIHICYTGILQSYIQ